MKSFVYLDEYKMYSLSSQIMEGVTDYVLKESSRKDSDTEEQLGPDDSGKKMGEIIQTTAASFEKKFLHDYAYSLFEQRLEELKKINHFSASSSFDELVSSIRDSRIVKLKARANFVDAGGTVETLNSFVELQTAGAILSTMDERAALLKELIEAQALNKKTQHLTSELARLSRSPLPKEVIANEQLQYESIAAVLAHGYKGRVDINMQMADCNVSADLKRAYLKDELDSLFKSYSRATDVELVMVGIVTRVRSEDSVESDDDGSMWDKEYMSEILMQASKAIGDIEGLFTKLNGHHVIVDPIAIYLDL